MARGPLADTVTGPRDRTFVQMPAPPLAGPRLSLQRRSREDKSPAKSKLAGGVGGPPEADLSRARGEQLVVVHPLRLQWPNR
jgi:hypothetical protein